MTHGAPAKEREPRPLGFSLVLADISRDRKEYVYIYIHSLISCMYAVIGGYEDLTIANKTCTRLRQTYKQEFEWSQVQVCNFAASFWGVVDYGGGGGEEGDQTEVSGYDPSIARTQSLARNSYSSSHWGSWRKKQFVIPVAPVYLDPVSRG